jgi:exonuclease SbcC
MKIKSLKIRDIGGLNNGKTVELPIAELGDAPLVAIHGVNGACKTTIIECIPGALYRDTPSRGALAGLANSAGSTIELGIETDELYNAVICIDATLKTPKQSAYLLNGQALNNGKVTTYDAEIARRFPSKEIYLSSAFAAQGGRGNFLDLDTASRRKLFADMLGLGRLAQLAKLAGEREKEAEQQVKDLRWRINSLSEQIAGQAPEDVAELEQKLITTRECIKADATAEAKAKEALDDWRNAREQIMATMAEAKARAGQAQIELTHANNEVVRLSHRVDEIGREKRTLTSEQMKVESYQEMAGRKGEFDLDVARLDAELAEDRAKVEAYQKARLAWIEDGHKARAEVDAIEQKIAKLKSDMTYDISERDNSRNSAEMLEKTSGLTSSVPCRAEGEYASCPLLSNAIKAKQTAKEYRADVATAERVIEKDRAEIEAIISGPEYAAAKERLETLRKSPPAESKSSTDAEIALRVARQKLANANSAVQAIAAVAGHADRIKTLTSELAIITKQLDDAKKLSFDCDNTFATAQDNVLLGSKTVLEHDSKKPKAFTSFADIFHAEELDLTKRIAAAQARIEAAEKADKERDALQETLSAATVQADDWRELATAFGPKGIPALEIDAAGPEVSQLANDLLHSCFGTRFTLALVTTALKGDGSGTKEVFDLSVIDTEKGREGPASHLSGGEKVLVNEALSLAIAIFNSQKSSIAIGDLFRDECAGALDGANASLYIAMLRRALDLGGFSRCYFIAHQPELWALADSRLLVADGDVTLED